MIWNIYRFKIASKLYISIKWLFEKASKTILGKTSKNNRFGTPKKKQKNFWRRQSL